jgi:predicted permease
MSAASRIRTWWRAVWRGAELDREMQAELEHHIASYAEDLERGGMERDEAERRARAELGSVAARKEDCRRAWGARMWDELGADVRYAVRMLRKSPGFTAIAVGSLALGIGANTVIFTLAKHVLMDRLDVARPGELRLLWNADTGKRMARGLWGFNTDAPGGGSMTSSFSYPVYQQLRRENRVFDDLFAFKPFSDITAVVDGQAEQVTAEMVTGNYYRALGVRPQLGRPIEDADDGAPGSGPVVVISDSYWARKFGRSPAVIGKTIKLNQAAMTIVGVNPAGFTGAFSTQIAPDVFLPFSMQPQVYPVFNQSPLTDAKLWWVLVMGRVKPGVADQTAQAALGVTLDAAVRSTMGLNGGAAPLRMLMLDGSRGQNALAEGLTKPIYVLTALAGLVLLLACVNLANLLLARASGRQREMSVRLALGAGRGRVLRQMLTESLLLALLGGAGGVALGYLCRNAIPKMMTASWEAPQMNSSFDWQIVGFAAGVSLLTGLLFGVIPAWQATRTEVSGGLKNSVQAATHRRRNWTGKALVTVQVTLSMLLLVGAGLFMRTLGSLSRVQLGFNPDHVLLFDIEQSMAQYPPPKDIALHRALEERLAAVPGVEQLGVSRGALISGSVGLYSIKRADKAASQDEQSVQENTVSTGFFRTMQIPLVAGREFDANDTGTSARVAVINEKMAKQDFAGEEPIGKFLVIQENKKNVQVQIVGICGDTKYDSLRKDVAPTFFMPYRQMTNVQGGMTYEIRTRMDPESLATALRAAVKQVDPNLPLLDIRTQNEQIAVNARMQRIFAELTGGFGGLALVLACIGIYGIMAYQVAQRTQEIGIRLALGAIPGQVLGMVLRETARLSVVGIVAGAVAAVALSRLVKSMLYGVAANDPWTLAGAAAVLLAVALGAGWIPARRAAGVEPMEALRHE